MSRRSTYSVVLLSLAALWSFAGCGRQFEFGLVEGVVMQDGKPLSKVMIQFMPDPEKGNAGPTSTAITDDQGHYSLRWENHSTKDDGEGAVVGWHRVVLHDTTRSGVPQGATPPPPRIPPQYATSSATPLRFQVQAGAQTIDLKVR